MKKINKRLQWFRDAGLGIFIHWGPCAVIGRGEWVKHQENIPDEEYDSCIRKFQAEKYNPDEWVKLAKEAGANYMVLITKHHDGYCLFDTKTTDYNSVKRGPKKDLTSEFVKACRKHKMRVGLYFSLPDWRTPAFFDGPEKNPEGWNKFVDFAHRQVSELMSNYGKIDLLWYDNILKQSGDRSLKANDYKAKKLEKMVRKLQPEIIINDRSLISCDFYTAEQNARPPEDKSRLWEACMTMNKHWSYFPSDKIWKTPAEIINTLTGIASNEGNMLLNIGPRPDGTIPAPNVRNLKAIGKWLKIHGEAIYGVENCPIPTGTAGVFTKKGDALYLIVHWWPGKRLSLPDFPYEIRSGEILGMKIKIAFKREGQRMILENLPAKAPNPMCSVIKLKLASKEKLRDMKSKEIYVNFREQN